MQKSSYFPTISGNFLAIFGISWLTLAIFWLFSGYFLAIVWLVLSNPGYSWQILAILWIILGNSA